jgi:peroxiredoxin
VTILGVTAKDTDEAMRAFVERHGLEDMVQLVDDDGSIWARYGVAYQPAWVFIDADGEVGVVAGALGEDALAERLEDLATGS